MPLNRIFQSNVSFWNAKVRILSSLGRFSLEWPRHQQTCQFFGEYHFFSFWHVWGGMVFQYWTVFNNNCLDVAKVCLDCNLMVSCNNIYFAFLVAIFIDSWLSIYLIKQNKSCFKFVHFPINHFEPSSNNGANRDKIFHATWGVLLLCLFCKLDIGYCPCSCFWVYHRFKNVTFHEIQVLSSLRRALVRSWKFLLN